MTTLDVAVFAWLAAVMAAAGVVHIRAWRETPPIARRERRLHAATAALAACYVAGYLAVLFHLVPVLVWSQFFRGVSLVTIPVVWIMPAATSQRRWAADKAAATELVAKARELAR